MNFNKTMSKIEAILKAVESRPKRKGAATNGIMSPRSNTVKRGSGAADDKGEPPVEVKLARYIALIRKSKAEMKKMMEKKANA